jgi:hypothetical protein
VEFEGELGTKQGLGSSCLPGCPIHAIAASSTSSPLSKAVMTSKQSEGRGRRRPETGSGPHHMGSSLPNLPHTCPDATYAYWPSGHACVRAWAIQRRDETTFPLFFLSHKIHWQRGEAGVCDRREISGYC